uniref:Ribosomal protein S18 domain containing protein n=2 Tax=Haemonchus contortus TaxID=6289 RepID=A0A7I4Y7F7_HAECO
MLSRSALLMRVAERRFTVKEFASSFRLCSTSQCPPDPSPVQAADPDAPIEVKKNPYEKEERKCLLCRTGIELDYKNARLLQQFVSTFSGRVYDRHITGLCDHQQKKLVETIALSRKSGYMPIFVKDPKYTRDPKLFDPLKPLRPHSFA